MKEVIIYGASDDLVEIEGAITAEFYANDAEDGDKLGFSDGTVLSIRYDKNGCWRINRLVQGSATYAKQEATDPDDDYTDRVTLTGDIKWVIFGDEFEKAT